MFLGEEKRRRTERGMEGLEMKRNIRRERVRKEEREGKTNTQKFYISFFEV